MVWTCRAQHRLDCRSTQAECGCTEKIWQAKEIMGWSAWEWQKEARYGFCWPSEPFWVERTPSRKTCQKAQPSVEENRALKWIWWWWWKQLIRIFMNLHGVIYIAIFSNMVQPQRAHYRVTLYIIVNNVTTATLESKTKNALKRQKRNRNSLNSLYFGVSNSFKDGSSKLNNHSAMAVGKFILALSTQFKFCFILWLLFLSFVWKWYEIKL